MKKFIFIPDSFHGYWETINSDLYDIDDVYIFSGFKNKLVRFLWKMHFSKRINKIIPMPFKSLWLKRYFQDSLLPNTKQIIVFREGSRGSFSPSFLKAIKKHNQKSVLILQMANPINNNSLLKNIERVKRYYDHVISFNKKDCEKYDLEFNNLPFCFEGLMKYRTNKVETDCFFIGSDKGRLNKIIEVYDQLEKYGLNCLFYIADVPLKKQVIRKGIIYNKTMSYRDVLKKVATTKCVLEIVNGDYSSIRFCEAIALKKRLLTTSNSTKSEPLYDERQVFVFKNATDIKKDFIAGNSFSVEDSSLIRRDRYFDLLFSFEQKEKII